MNCQQFTEEITAYLDGEVPGSTAAEMETHTRTCGHCAAELEAFKDSVAFVDSSVRELEPSPAIWRNVQARIAVDAKPSGRWLGLPAFGWRTATAAIAAVLVLTLGVWTYVQHENEQRELDRYMSDYIQYREYLQKQQAARTSDHFQGDITTGAYPVSEENPFIMKADFSSPFATEGR